MSTVVATERRRTVTGDNWDLRPSVVSQRNHRTGASARGLLGAFPGSLIYLAIAVVALIALMAVDGLRRESAELTTSLQSFQGEVNILKAAGYTVSPVTGMQVRERDAIVTGVDGTAVLVFPDGSAVQVEPSTKFTVRRLDLARGGARERSFMVDFGSAVMRVSRFFGAKSEVTVCTPTAVAAARGTGFRVTYDPDVNKTVLEVAHGKVEFTSNGDSVICGAGRGVVVEGHSLGNLYKLSDASLSELSSILGGLAAHERQTGMLQGVEWGLLHAANPVLEVANVPVGNRGDTRSDKERIAECTRSLNELRLSIRKLPQSGPPSRINYVTLDELNLKTKDRTRILNSFANQMLSGYQVLDDKQFELSARARDRKRTSVRVIGSMKESDTEKEVVRVGGPASAADDEQLMAAGSDEGFGGGALPKRISAMPYADEAIVTGYDDAAKGASPRPIEKTAGYVSTTGEPEAAASGGDGASGTNVATPIGSDAGVAVPVATPTPVLDESGLAAAAAPSAPLAPASIASMAKSAEILSKIYPGLGAVGAALLASAAESAREETKPAPTPSPVPEPGTLAVLGAGVVALGLRRRFGRVS